MTASNDETYEFEWTFRHLTITVEVRLKFQYFGLDHDHLEIRSLHPRNHALPTTETGYKSLWPIHGEFSSAEEAASAVTKWFDEAASKPEWLNFVSASEQPTLF